MSKKYYSKTLENLTIPELLCYGIELGLKKVKSTQTKDQIVRDIVEKKDDFLENESETYYFIKDESKHTLEYVKNPTENLQLYQSKRLANSSQRIPIAKLKSEIAKENQTDDHSSSSIDLTRFTFNNDQIVDTAVAHNTENNDDKNGDNTDDTVQQQALLQVMQTLAANSKKSEKSFHFRQKLKYEPSHGIEAFIRGVESYADANGISDRTKWVSIAKSALNSSEDGLLLQDSLTPTEETDWTLFKSKLLSILGNPPDYYRDYYRSFRRGTQKLGLAMSRLTQAYKRGFLFSGDALSDHDKRHIKLQFISSLDNPLRGLVKAEEKNLTFSTIADRAAELERCFGNGFGPENAAALMFPEGRVNAVNVSNDQRMQETLQREMFDLVKTLTQQSRAQHTEMMKLMSGLKINQPTSSSNNFNQPISRSNGRGLDPAIASKLQGYCYSFVKFGKCKNRNCSFKHSDQIPEEVKKVIA